MTVLSTLSDALPLLWGVIGISFMATAPSNWHATLLNEDCQKNVPIEREDVRPLFGMFTHVIFFVGELNWGIASQHAMGLMGFQPALCAAPIISTLGMGVFKLKLGRGGPTGLPIKGPPAPVPQIALGVSLFMMFSTAYRAWLGEQLKVAGREGPKDVWQFCAAFSVIFGVPNLFSQYHLATSPWQGAPIKRGNDDKRDDKES